MPSEISWVAPADIVEINRIAVAATGEPFILVRPDALESACARPMLAHDYGRTDLVDLAVSFLFAVAVSHPFIQGNKRTATLAALLFLGENGAVSRAPDDDLADRIVSVLEHQLSEEAFADWLRPFVHAV